MRITGLTIKRRTLRLIFLISAIFLLVGVLSYLVFPFCTDGDQFFYRQFYSDVGSVSLPEAFVLSLRTISAAEPVYVLICWLASDYIPKDLLMSLSNGILAVTFLFAARKAGMQLWPAVFLIFTNFYFYVLYFGAERLKFSFIFLFLAYALIDRPGLKRASMFVLSVLAHLQSTLIAIPTVFYQHFQSTRALRRWMYAGTLLAIFAVAAYFIQAQILSKLAAYSDRDRDPLGMLRLVPFVALSLYFSKTRVPTALLYLPIIAIASIVGPDRVVIFAYFIFLYIAARTDRNRNIATLIVLVLNLYFAVKGIGFLGNVFAHGDGFNNGDS